MTLGPEMDDGRTPSGASRRCGLTDQSEHRSRPAESGQTARHQHTTLAQYLLLLFPGCPVEPSEQDHEHRSDDATA